MVSSAGGRVCTRGQQEPGQRGHWRAECLHKSFPYPLCFDASSCTSMLMSQTSQSIQPWTLGLSGSVWDPESPAGVPGLRPVRDLPGARAPGFRMVSSWWRWAFGKWSIGWETSFSKMKIISHTFLKSEFSSLQCLLARIRLPGTSCFLLTTACVEVVWDFIS